MAATTYSDPKTYLPYRKKSKKDEGCGCGKKKHHDHEEDCECKECQECGCEDKKCGCCPPGLVAVYDDSGNQTACLTPNDAELYQKNTFTCEDGYVKLIRTSDSSFLGCVSEKEFETLYPIVNPA